MAGDSIAQVRQALYTLVQTLTPGDAVSFSRFGSTALHGGGGRLQQWATPLSARIAETIVKIEADMGEAETGRELLAAINDVAEPESVRPSFTLIITDGAVWNVDEVIRAGQASGQRIFVIGVGSAPAESALRELANKTGGACELVSPNENITRSIRNMVTKMRCPSSNVPHLVSEPATLFLVHEMEGGNSDELSMLHQVPQMMAAGHKGFGTVRHQGLV